MNALVHFIVGAVRRALLHPEDEIVAQLAESLRAREHRREVVTPRGMRVAIWRRPEP